MPQLTVMLEPQERMGLQMLAEAELRDPRQQVRLLVVAELRRRGLLPPDDDTRERRATPTVPEQLFADGNMSSVAHGRRGPDEEVDVLGS